MESERSGVIFRRMRLEDVPVICEIEVECFAIPWTADAFHNELTNNANARYLVMVERETIVGYGGMWIILDEAHVTNVAIREPFRGGGRGQKLMQQLQMFAVWGGADQMTLEVRRTNAVAQHIYEKLGFKVAGVRRGYYSDNGEDALVMWADLRGLACEMGRDRFGDEKSGETL